METSRVKHNVQQTKKVSKNAVQRDDKNFSADNFKIKNSKKVRQMRNVIGEIERSLARQVAIFGVDIVKIVTCEASKNEVRQE